MKDICLNELKGYTSRLITKKVLLPTMICCDIIWLLFAFAIFMIANIFISVNYFLVFFILLALNRIYKYIKFARMDDSTISIVKNIFDNVIDNIIDTAEGK